MTIGGDKTMDLQNPKAKEFIQRLSTPKKFPPWPAAKKSGKQFKCKDGD